MKRLQTGLLCYAALLVGACKANSLHRDQPALIVHPTAESRAELKRVVTDMLSGAEVTLADGALTESSVLIVEREKIRNLQNPPLSGRDLGRPERFQLMTTGTTCVLIHEKNHSRHELIATSCVAE